MTSVLNDGVSAAGVSVGSRGRWNGSRRAANQGPTADRRLIETPPKIRFAYTIAATLGFSVLAAGCATKPDPSDSAAVEAYNEANDPLEPMNRHFFEVSQFLDEVLLKPFAGWYHIALPDPAEDGVRNFLRNLKSPVILANDLFQGEFSRAGTTVARFFINRPSASRFTMSRA